MIVKLCFLLALLAFDLQALLAGKARVFFANPVLPSRHLSEVGVRLGEKKTPGDLAMFTV